MKKYQGNDGIWYESPDQAEYLGGGWNHRIDPADEIPDQLPERAEEFKNEESSNVLPEVETQVSPEPEKIKKPVTKKKV